MTRRVWIAGVGVFVLLAVWLAVATAAPGRPLRSRHSEPATTAPDVVLVSADGKLFHRAGCIYIHGPARSEPGTKAIADGYTPCTRCLPRTSGR